METGSRVWVCAHQMTTPRPSVRVHPDINGAVTAAEGIICSFRLPQISLHSSGLLVYVVVAAPAAPDHASPDHAAPIMLYPIMLHPIMLPRPFTYLSGVL